MLAAFLGKFTPEHTIAGVTGLPIETIERVAMLYGRAKAAFIGWTMGVNHSTQGAETVNAVNNLALLTGQIGRAGAAPFSITGQCNAMGSRETSFTTGLPGYRKFESAEDRAEVAAIWNVPVERIPTARGMAYPDIIEGAVAKKIRALWIIATNPVVSFPNYDVLKQAFENLEFLVVQDGFHPNPTSELAHLVLPAAVWGEKGKAPYTNSERRVSKVNKIVEPPGAAKSDFDIFLAVAEKLGVREELFPRAGHRLRDGIRRMAARLEGPAVRLQRDDVGVDRGSRMESSGAASGSTLRWRVPDSRWPRETFHRRVRTLPGAAHERLSVDSEYGPYGGALAHANQDRPGGNSEQHVAACLAGDESTRRERSWN